MRILIYTHAFPPMVGGIETITMELAKGLADRFAEDGFLGQNEVIVATPVKAKLHNEETLPFRIVRKPGMFQLAKLIWQADLLHIAGPNMLPLLLGQLLRKPTVVEHHGFQTVCPSGQLVYQPQPSPCPGQYMAGRYSACLKCNAHNGVFHGLKQLLLTFVRRRLCFTVSANIMPTGWLHSIVRLPHAVTVHHGLPAAPPPSRIHAEGPPTIVFQGRLVSTKGVVTLLRAVHLLKDCEVRLQIIGDGPDRPGLMAEAAHLSITDKVQFLGFLPPAMLEQVITNARVIVMPSLGGEVFGLVALENMQRGKTVVVSEIGALSEVVGDPDLTFPPGDAPALAACLRRILVTPGFAQTAAANARKRADAFFTADKMVAEHLKIYERLVPLPSSTRELAQSA